MLCFVNTKNSNFTNLVFEVLFYQLIKNVREIGASYIFMHIFLCFKHTLYYCLLPAIK